ncbi:MAG: hypothetical protein WCF85_15950 [Rhodospirillaceae bacterium]
MIGFRVRLFAVLIAVGMSTAARADEPSAPVGEWRVGPVVTKAGTFAYCVAERRYNNGRTLIIARSPRDEVNIGIGMPGAKLAKGSAWRVKLSVDREVKRDRQAVAADPDLVNIANGSDERLFDALTTGEVFTIEGPSDTIAFQLGGTGKALREMRSCVEQTRSGQPSKPLGRLGESGAPQLQPLLARLLAEAGFKKIGVMAPAAAPPGYGPVDALWKVGAVTGGLVETRSERAESLSALSENVLVRLKERCGATYALTGHDPQTLPAGSFRTAEIACGKVSLALVFNLGHGGLFKTFFFEAPELAAAIHDRDAIADVLKRLANNG